MRSLIVAAAICGAQASSRLYQFEHGERHWMEEEEIMAFHHKRIESGNFGLGFVDVTDHPEMWSMQVAPPKRKVVPAAPQQQDLVKPLIDRMSASSMENFLVDFSSFSDRYYTSDTGVQSQYWLGEQMESAAAKAGYSNFNMSYFQHSWAQPSPVGRIEGSTFPDEVIIVSAHSDSVRNSPGADDDGSGVANYFEVFKTLVESGYTPRRTIEFIGWAAEEVGLRGSNDIANLYDKNGVDVVAVYHNEMSGYEGGAANRQIVLLTDYVDSALTNFNELLVTEYCDIPAKRSTCGYGCSDHYAWSQRGFAASCTAEAGPYDQGLNPYYHTRFDTIDKMDFSYSLEFAKLALAFVVEIDQY